MSDQPDEVVSRGRRDTPHWSQPCTNLLRDESNTPLSLSSHILQELSVAHSLLFDLKDHFAQEVMSTTWEELVGNIIDPNASFEFLDMEPASDSSFNTMLLYAYQKMQRVAVGIEQVTLDQALYRGSLLSEFRSIESHIVNVLCNLHYAMVHQNLTPTAKVTKEIMRAKYRDLDGTSARAHRDSIIMIKYNEAIENLSNIFKKFTDQ